jgi:predicted ribosomally synthesized six-cysteine peptide SCIFF
MKHITTISKGTLKQTEGKGCGECQTSCQSACKTSCTIANQECEQTRIKRPR